MGNCFPSVVRERERERERACNYTLLLLLLDINSPGGETVGIVDSRGTWSDRYLNVVCIHFPAASPFARDDPRIRPLSRNAIGWRKEKEKIKFLGNSMATGGNKSRTLTTDNFSFWVEEQFREGGSLVTWHRALSFCSTPLFSNCTLHILFSIFKVSATRRLFQVLISRNSARGD